MEYSTDDYNRYIDSIIDNYKNLGEDPCISILSDNIYKNGRKIVIMYSSRYLKKCINNTKHFLDCKCNHILYESFYVSNNLELIYNYNDDNRSIPIYIYDLSNLIIEVYKKFYLI
jgi:hypothetical protein